MIGYLIDMDGVIHRGGHLIPGADRFVNGLRDANIPFLFLTNNSQRTRRDVATRLQRLGIDVTEHHVFTCAMATAQFLSQQKPCGLKAFSVGKPSPVMLRAARKELALPTDQTVVIGDTMETDILGGVQLNYKTVLVLTGSTRREDVGRYAYLPDMIVESIADLDPGVLEREFGPAPAAANPPFTHFHPSHRPRPEPAIAGAF
jgi:ribonucleotide monophosphatase NagD (HAD superfamily)